MTTGHHRFNLLTWERGSDLTAVTSPQRCHQGESDVSEIVLKDVCGMLQCSQFYASRIRSHNPCEKTFLSSDVLVFGMKKNNPIQTDRKRIPF